MYCSGRTKVGYHPIVNINVRKFIDENKPLEEIIDTASYFFDWVIRNMTVPGKVETLFVIIDLNKVTLPQLPISQVKGFISVLQHRFRGRLFRMMILTSPGFNGIWNLVSTWIDEHIKAKIVMCEIDNCKKTLLEFICPEVLEI